MNLMNLNMQTKSSHGYSRCLEKVSSYHIVVSACEDNAFENNKEQFPQCIDLGFPRSVPLFFEQINGHIASYSSRIGAIVGKDSRLSESVNYFI